MDELPTVDLGFDFVASREANTVVGVKEGGPAFLAGLRDGRKLMGWSVYNEQPDTIAKFQIRTEAGPEAIEYYPRGRHIVVPQFHLEGGANGAACGNWSR